MKLALLVLLAVVACTTPKILTPPVPHGECDPNSEHACAGGGCCLLNWDCGGVQYANEPAICPVGMCCDANFPPDPPGAARRHTKPKRGGPCSCVEMGVDISGPWTEVDAGYWTGVGKQYVRDCYTREECGGDR